MESITTPKETVVKEVVILVAIALELYWISVRKFKTEQERKVFLHRQFTYIACLIVIGVSIYLLDKHEHFNVTRAIIAVPILYLLSLYAFALSWGKN